MTNSKIFLGNINIDSLFQGADDISIYLGNEKVYPLAEPTFKWKATYSDSHTESAACDASSAITLNEIVTNNLVSVTIGDCVTSIGNGAFVNCSSLTSIDIPDSVTSIGSGAFYMCNGLTSCTIGSGVTSIGTWAFSCCSGLTSVIIPSGVTSIDERAFYNCSSLTSVTIETTTPPTLGYVAFYGSTCPIYVPCESVDIYKAASGWSDYASRITCVTPPFDGKWLATYSDSHTESAQCDSSSEIVRDEINLTNLVSVEIGDCITSIGDSAFIGCDGLTNIVIPDSVISIGEQAFIACSSLTSIDIPNSVTSIGGNAFNFCTGLTSIIIPDSVTSIGESAFEHCESLINITVEATTPPTLGSGAFNNTNNCPIYVPSGSVLLYIYNWSEYASRIQAIP